MSSRKYVYSIKRAEEVTGPPGMTEYPEYVCRELGLGDKVTFRLINTGKPLTNDEQLKAHWKRVATEPFGL